MVQLKKRKSNKHSEIVSSVRINVIRQAALFLAKSEAFCEAKVQINLQELQTLISQARNKLFEDFVDVNDGNDSDSSFDVRSISCDSFSEAEVDEENNDNNLESNNVRVSMPNKKEYDETCLLPGYVFAPGENNTPLSLLIDKHADSLTFVKIYAGTIRRIPEHLSYQRVIQSELIRYDRRCCDPYRIMYCASKIRLQKMYNSIQLHLRKNHSEGLTAGQLLDPGYVNNLQLSDYAYRVFEHDRGSPAFFEKKKKELFAMIRQLGPPSIFLTLSSAETKWPELLVNLKVTVDKEIISVNDATQLPYPERARLLSSDPVTSANFWI